MRALAFLPIVALLVLVQTRMTVAMDESVVAIMHQLGPVGRWAGCMYGHVRGDTLMVPLMLPQVDGRCTHLGLDSTDVIGLMVPMDSTRVCDWTVHDKMDFIASGHAYRVRWCGGKSMNVLRFKKADAPNTRVGA